MRGVYIAAEHRYMNVIFIQLLLYVAGKAGIVTACCKIIIADGFGKRQLDLMDPIFLCLFKYFFHLHFRTQVMAAHTSV